MSLSSLEQLQQFSIIVADSSDLEAIEQFNPMDATTNPSLITLAAHQKENLSLLETAFAQAKAEGLQADALIERSIDILTVLFGVHILQRVAGRVSTEVDASLSYDCDATVQRALELIELYQRAGVDSARVLIKIAATWQGIQAAKILQTQGIQTNLTLLFGLHQAHACANAGVRLISPFVGRIYDWYKQHDGVSNYAIEADPGVQSVRKIYQFYQQHQIPTQVMAASFRSTAQITALAGCDLLTISPHLLQQLQQEQTTVTRQIQANSISASPLAILSEADFHEKLQHDLMATQLLQSGIDGFIKAREQLNLLLRQSFGMYDISP